MAIAVLFEFPNDSLSKYDEVLQGEPRTQDQPARSFHVCFEMGSGFGVLDVWDSEEAFARFGDVLRPILAKVGLQGEPKIYPVHNTI